MKSMKKLMALMMVFVMSTMLTGCIGNPYKTGIKSLKDGEYTKAAESFKEAIEEEKNLADSYRGLGISLWEQGEYEEAYEALGNAISEGTEVSPTLYSLMANCAMQIENYDEAAEYYELALSMKDISEELKKETQYNLIAAYEYAGNVEKAKESIDEYIASYPDEADELMREAEFLETR